MTQQRTAWRQRTRRRLAIGLAIVLGAVVVSLAVGADVPTWLNNHLQVWARDTFKWISRNRTKHWLFTGVFTPIADAMTWMVDAVLWGLRSLRWPGVMATAGIVAWRTGGWRAAAMSVAALVVMGAVGYWSLTLITLSVMMVAIVIAMAIGVPLGIWCARSPRASAVLQPVLDTAQVIPAFSYLGLLTLAFGIKAPPVIAATVIYAVPPAVRITALGIRQVPVVLNEVGESFGATERQHLFKVQLPVARRTLLLGLNQVIMMAFGIVVIGSLLGTGDTGNEVLKALQKLDLGKASAAGIAIVAAAVMLDRATTGHRLNDAPRNGRRWLAAGGISAVALALIAKAAGWAPFPESLTVDITGTVTDIATWLQEHLRSGVPIIGGTESISRFLVADVLEPLRTFLTWLPWLVVVAGFAAVGWWSRGWKLALTVAVCLIGIASMGDVPGGGVARNTMWDQAMDTLSQVMVAVVISVLIAVPLGIVAGRSNVFNTMIRPVLDFAQVLPQFVYLVPVLFLFNAGRSAGIVACVVYAVPPGIRLTSLGLREVPVAPREAAISFGATPRQELWKVQLPLALRSVLLGINQTILMVLATVVIAALIGSGGLGLTSLGGMIKQQQNFGPGIAAGLSIVLLAVTLDRVTQAWGDRGSPPVTARS